MLYSQIWKMIAEKQANNGCFTKLIARLETDLKNEFSEQKSYSDRNCLEYSFF